LALVLIIIPAAQVLNSVEPALYPQIESVGDQTPEQTIYEILWSSMAIMLPNEQVVS